MKMKGPLEEQQREQRNDANVQHQDFETETIILMDVPLLPNTDYEIGNLSYQQNSALLTSHSNSSRGREFCCSKCGNWFKSQIRDFINIYTNQSGSCLNTFQGLSTIFATGTILGVCLPNNHSNLSTPIYRYISSVMSYTHILCWSLSLYPQVILNHQLKSVSGLSTDSQVINFFNHLCFIVFNAVFVFHQPNSIGTGGEFELHVNGVKTKDLVYSSHALFVTLALLWQLCRYKGFVLSPISFATIGLLAALLFICIAYTVEILTHTYGFHWSDFLRLLVSMKVILSASATVPQLTLNKSRNSTEGWNIWNVVLDFTGTILFIGQIIGDSIDSREYLTIKYNWPKLSICLFNLIFDVSIGAVLTF